MERRENHDQQPLGICQRLFNFIMKNLVSQSLKRRIRYISSNGYEPMGSVDATKALDDEEFAPLARIEADRSNEVSHIPAHDEVLDSSCWIPVEVAREQKIPLKTISVKDDNDDDGFKMMDGEDSSTGKPVAIQEVHHQRLQVDEHFEEFIQRMKKKLRKPSFHEGCGADTFKYRDGERK